ncbi:MAG: ABC transporter permease, partial [Vulcanimicrobiaceae bacterium]
MGETLDYLVGGVLQGCVFALVALGFALVFRVAGAVNLAQGAFVILGALTLYTFWQTLHWPLVAAFGAALAVALLVGALVGRYIFEPGLRRLPGSGMVMLTAGLLVLFEGLFLLVWGSQPYQLPPFGDARPMVIGGVHIATQAVWVAIATVAIVAVLGYVLQKTTLGRALRACAENPAAASLMGIDVRRMTVVSFAIASGIGAIGGMVFGPIVSLQFDGGRFFTIAGFIAVAIGGAGSFIGALVGGLGLGVVQQLAAGYVSSLFSSTLALVILLAILIFKPAGLFRSRIGRREDVRDIALHGARPTIRFEPKTVRIAGAVAVVALGLFPLVPGTSGILSSFVIAGIVFIAVLGLDVLMGFAGQVSLGHAAFVAIGGYAAAIGTTRWHLPALLAILMGLAVSLVSAAVLSVVTVRLRGLYMVLATLAFGLLIDSLAVGLGDFTGGPSGITGIPHLSIGGFTFGSQLANYELVLGLAVLGTIVLA